MLPDELMKNNLSAYRYRIELHAHTSPCSPCSDIPPGDLVRLMEEQHYDGVVITNHFFPGSPALESEDPIGAYLEDFWIAREEGVKRGVQVLLGAEYRFTENINDYLVYGVDQAFLQETVGRLEMGIEAFYREYHSPSRLILQAHPFRDGMTPVPSEFLDGIETMNMHSSHNSRVVRALLYARKMRFAVTTIGTDLHHFGQEGSSALRTRTLPRTEGQLVELLRSGDYIFEVGGCPMLPGTALW